MKEVTPKQCEQKNGMFRVERSADLKNMPKKSEETKKMGGIAQAFFDLAKKDGLVSDRTESRFFKNGVPVEKEGE